MIKFKKPFIYLLMATMVINVPAASYAAKAQTSVTTTVKNRTMSKAEKNVLMSMFDAEYYAKQYPDVVKALGNKKSNLFNHFIKYGIYEGRNLSEDFDASVYRACYNDLDNAFGDDIVSYYVHYANFGKKEKLMEYFNLKVLELQIL